MNVQETERLILGTVDDFRTLLGGHGIAQIDRYSIFPPYPGEARWFAKDAATGTSHHLPAEIAVPAVTESWRDRLGKKHGVFISINSAVMGLPAEHMRPVYTVSRADPPTGFGPWREVFLTEAPSGSPNVRATELRWIPIVQGSSCFDSLPEAVRAAVHALASEIRDQPVDRGELVE